MQESTRENTDSSRLLCSMGLDGKTSAAEIVVKGENKWLTLIQNAANVDSK